MRLPRKSDLTLIDFLPLVSTKFQVWLDANQQVELELAEAASIGPDPRPAAPEETGRHGSFSLIFHGPESSFLPQRTYTFSHGKLGELSLFIVPIARAGGAFHYQAIFNRLSPQP